MRLRPRRFKILIDSDSILIEQNEKKIKEIFKKWKTSFFSKQNQRVSLMLGAKVLLAVARFAVEQDVTYSVGREGYEKEIRREETLRPCCEAQL